MDLLHHCIAQLLQHKSVIVTRTALLNYSSLLIPSHRPFVELQIPANNYAIAIFLNYRSLLVLTYIQAPIQCVAGLSRG
jgi:hypothetical protein